MAGRRIRDEAEARALLEASAASGLPRGAWARQHGIDGRSLHAWALNLGRAGGAAVGEAAMRFVEVVATEEEPFDAEARYVVRLGDVTVEVGDDFRDETLQRLLRVVATC